MALEDRERLALRHGPMRCVIFLNGQTIRDLADM